MYITAFGHSLVSFVKLTCHQPVLWIIISAFGLAIDLAMIFVFHIAIAQHGLQTRTVVRMYATVASGVL